MKRISCRYCVNYCLGYIRIDVVYYHIHFLILLALILCDLILCRLLFLHLPITQTCLSFIFVLNLCRMISFSLALSFLHKTPQIGMLMKMIVTTASIRLLIIFLSIALALASCDDEL